MQVAYALTQLVQNLTERSGVTAQWRFSWLVMTVFCTVYASGIKQQARYAVGSMFDVMEQQRCYAATMLRSRGSRPKQVRWLKYGHHSHM